ncbi:phage major capsid protein [Nostoc sp. UHCC 0870]|uniref:phage major capsid protein n=1 Tax=Nostoc sp. UHCC 0870 TaxID=2914041 RepID=UPI001EDE5001|nr:phage major capsid protein [Nostoc sp. UHCC 0870]UKO99369.1 phage major capsid protein [Nostoc sp. UHCC 0870]
MTVIVDPIKSLQLVVQEEIASLQLNQYPMLSRLTKKITSQRVIKWNANTGGASVTGEATTADVSSFSEDAVVGASLPIGTHRLRHSFQVQKEDIAEAAAAGKGALRDLFGYEIQSGIRAIMEALSGQVYTGTGLAAHGGVVGLGSVVANAAYAGIDPATYTLWSAIFNTNGSNRALTSALMLAMETAIARKAGNFTAIYTTPEIVAKYKELFNANLGIINQLPAGQADLGYTGVTYAGRPIISDPYCPNNILYFVNEPEVTLYTFGQNNTQSREGMQVAIESLPSSNPDAEKYVIYVKPQLKVHNRAKGAAALNAITQ